MKKIFLSLILLSVVQLGFAGETRPSVDSIKRLLVVTQAQDLLETTFDQMESYIQNAMGQQLSGLGEQGKKEQQEIMALIRKEFNEEVMEAIYLDVYGESFSQAEIDAITAFYESEAGQAILNKMPFLMQNVMTRMQTQMQNILSKIEELQ